MKYNRVLILFMSLLIFGLMFNAGCENKKSEVSYHFKSLDGDEVKFDKYKGKYSILSFSFTGCQSICPMINRELVKLREKYKNQINIVSINVDPENDSPESLKKYMSDQGFDWDILIGDVENIEKVMNNMLDKPDRKLGKPSEHLSELHLMDKDFIYIDNFFPDPTTVGRLIKRLDSLDL